MERLKHCFGGFDVSIASRRNDGKAASFGITVTLNDGSLDEALCSGHGAVGHANHLNAVQRGDDFVVGKADVLHFWSQASRFTAIGGAVRSRKHIPETRLAGHIVVGVGLVHFPTALLLEEVLSAGFNNGVDAWLAHGANWLRSQHSRRRRFEFGGTKLIHETRGHIVSLGLDFSAALVEFFIIGFIGPIVGGDSVGHGNEMGIA